MIILAKDFIRHLLVLDPRNRFTAREALNHPFITQHCGSVDVGATPRRSSTHTSVSSGLSESEASAAPGRPIGNKTSIDDSACMTSNEKISNKNGSGEKLAKKGGIFGQWFKGKNES